MNSGSQELSLKPTVSKSKTTAKTNPVYFPPPRFEIMAPPNGPLRRSMIADNLAYLEDFIYGIRVKRLSFKGGYGRGE
jgi:hypothetical protein